jgi:hypothetical protein
LRSEIQCNFIDSDEEEDVESEEEENVQSKIKTINNLLSNNFAKLYEKINMEDYDDYTDEVMIY